MRIQWYTGWWFGTFFFSHILRIIIPIDYFFSEGFKPPTSDDSWWFNLGTWVGARKLLLKLGMICKLQLHISNCLKIPGRWVERKGLRLDPRYHANWEGPTKWISNLYKVYSTPSGNQTLQWTKTTDIAMFDHWMVGLDTPWFRPFRPDNLPRVHPIRNLQTGWSDVFCFLKRVIYNGLVWFITISIYWKMRFFKLL